MSEILHIKAFIKALCFDPDFNEVQTRAYNWTNTVLLVKYIQAFEA